MMRFITWAGCVTLLAFLTSCATPTHNNVALSARNIGILSLVGDQVRLSQPGFLSSVREDQRIPDSGFDETARKAAADAITQKNPAANPIYVDIPTEELIKRTSTGMLAAYNGGLSDIKPELQAWLRTHPVDLVVIIRGLNNVVDGPPERYFRGVGLYTNVFSGKTYIAAVIGVDVWDGKTLTELSSADVVDKSDVTASYLPSVKDNFSDPARRAAMVSDIKRALNSLVPRLVREVGL